MRAGRVAALGAAAGITAAAVAGTSGASGPSRVVARDDDGRVVASLELTRAGSFGLAYRHSYERAAAEERFRARAGGGFELREIRSADAGVLDYYELMGRRRRVDGRWVLTLARPVAYDALALAASAHGRRTLVADGARAPLHPRRGTRHVSIKVEGH